MQTELKYVYKGRYDPGTKINMHMHSCSEIVLYVSANGKTVINGNEYMIKSGDIAVIHANSPHDEIHFDTAEVIFFAYASDKELIPDEGVYRTGIFQKLRTLTSTLLTESKNKSLKHDIMMRATVEEIIVLFERSISKKYIYEHSLEHFANFIKENCSSELDIKKLANDYGMDYDRLRREFKAQFGLAPKQYIINSRLLLSHSLLSESELSCTEICMMCGFSDCSQFSKMFRRRFGVSPSKIRK